MVLFFLLSAVAQTLGMYFSVKVLMLFELPTPLDSRLPPLPRTQPGADFTMPDSGQETLTDPG